MPMYTGDATRRILEVTRREVGMVIVINQTLGTRKC